LYGGVRGRKTKVGRKLPRFPPTRFFYPMCHIKEIKHSAYKLRREKNRNIS
jgi:hypothetical protein